MITFIVVGAAALAALVAWRLRCYWRMYDDPKAAVRAARRESRRLAQRPFSDRNDDDAWGAEW